MERDDLASLALGGSRILPEHAQQRICSKRRGVQMLDNHRQWWSVLRCVPWLSSCLKYILPVLHVKNIGPPSVLQLALRHSRLVPSWREETIQDASWTASSALNQGHSEAPSSSGFVMVLLLYSRMCALKLIATACLQWCPRTWSPQSPQLPFWQELTFFVFSNQDNLLQQDEDMGRQECNPICWPDKALKRCRPMPLFTHCFCLWKFCF